MKKCPVIIYKEKFMRKRKYYIVGNNISNCVERNFRNYLTGKTMHNNPQLEVGALKHKAPHHRFTPSPSPQLSGPLTRLHMSPGTFLCGSVPAALAGSSCPQAQLANCRLCIRSFPPASPTEWPAVYGGGKSRPGLHWRLGKSPRGT